MADENTEVQEVAKPKLNTGLIKMILAGVVVIILCAGIAFGAALLVAKNVGGSAQETRGDGYGKVKSESLGTTYDAGEFITNLAGEGGRFVKLKIVLAFPDPKMLPEIVNKVPEFQHTVNSTLRQQTAEALSEPKAMEKLSELLKKNLNALLINGNITNVYFTSFVVQ